jgi:hypothetical protein
VAIASTRGASSRYPTGRPVSNNRDKPLDATGGRDRPECRGSPRRRRVARILHKVSIGSHERGRTESFMAHARIEKSPLDSIDVKFFERERMKKLEIAIAILVSLIAATVVLAHFVGQGMPFPAVY